MAVSHEPIVLSLDSSPPCRLHLPQQEQLAWVIKHAKHQQELIATLVHQLFENEVSVDVFGPAITPPSDFPLARKGEGVVGVHVERSGEEKQSSFIQYQTMGGPLVLQKSDPTSVGRIIRKALENAQKMLQS